MPFLMAIPYRTPGALFRARVERLPPRGHRGQYGVVKRGRRAGHVIWRTDDTGATWDLSGHFGATVRQGGHDEHTVWS